jgi:6,7-dimethyl-8-ribityllumazine synthase
MNHDAGQTPLPISLRDEQSIVILVSQFNREIGEGLLRGAKQALAVCGVGAPHIEVLRVPGAFELPLAAQWVLKQSHVVAALALGCVIRGETAHFDYVCQGVTQGLMNVALAQNKPVLFGVLTTQNWEQAQARAGDSPNNKGWEVVCALSQMLKLQHDLGLEKQD